VKTQRSTIAKWSLNAGLFVGLALIVLLVLVAPSQASVATATDATAVPAAAGASEILVFDWNKPVTKAEHGFPWDKPPKGVANSNWKLPPGYDKGVMHVRGVMINAREPRKDMKIQFCIWQNRSKVENCTKTYKLEDRTGAVVEFSVPVQNLWKKNGKIIDWASPRDRNGIAIKRLDGKPVSDYSGWNWNGENPADWYPMDARFTVVVTAPGATFSGWDNYDN
jgi:hypothetical protein